MCHEDDLPGTEDDLVQNDDQHSLHENRALLLVDDDLVANDDQQGVHDRENVP